MNILRATTKLDTSVQEDLAEYGIMREKAKEGIKSMKGTDPKYFGMRREGKEYNLYFPTDIDALDTHKGMSMAVVAPENQAFDMLAPKKYGKTLSMKDEKSVRAYLRKLLDSI